MSAIALVGIASCNKVEQNPNYNAETEEVNTQFVISVSTGNKPQTKMTANNVQQGTNFLGIQNAKLYTFQTGNSSPVYVTDPTKAPKKLFELGSLYAANAITISENDASKSNRILQLSVPTGVDAVLFYGKATNSNTEDSFSNATAEERGATVASFGDTPSETMFTIKRRIGSDANVTKYDNTAKLMIYVINQIINTEISSLASYSGYNDLPALKWKDLGHKYQKDNSVMYAKDSASVSGFNAAAHNLDRALSPLEEALGSTWSLMTNVGPDRYRAGSSKAIANMIASLKSQIDAQAGATPSTKEEANAKRLAAEISNQIARFFNTDGTYKDPGDMNIPAADVTAYGLNVANSGSLNNYPHGDFNIPEGAAQLAFLHENHGGQEDVFYYLHPNNALVRPHDNPGTFDPKKYVYPAELYYYVNSGLRVTDHEVKASDFPNGVTPWNTEDATDENNLWTKGEWIANAKVTSHTHGVAVKDNIQYGVALMQTSVQWGKDPDTGNEITQLEDNRAQFTTGEGNATIDLTKVNIELTGILIGGVNPTYDWQFLPVDGTGTSSIYGNFDGVLYDDDIVAATVPTPANSETYTLVYDNYKWGADKAGQNDVVVTLEFVNKGDAFWGKEDLIPTNGTFYLVGKLKVNGSGDGTPKNTINWSALNAFNQVPPIYLDSDTVPAGKHVGESKEIERVFIQNCMTKVVFRIGKTSLQNAFYSIPDLKQAQMSLGLSVDLSWQEGYEYDIEF